MMLHWRSVPSISGFILLEYKTEKKTRELNIPLWDKSQSVDVCIMKFGSGMPLIRSQLVMVAKLLGAVSEKPDIVSCGVVGVDMLKTLDKMPSSKIGLQYPLSVHDVQVEKLLRKPSYSVMGRNDMFALLR